MKYTLIGALALYTLAFAGGKICTTDPRDSVEVETWFWDGSQWVSQGTGNPAAMARLWSSHPSQGSCNRKNWIIPVTVHTSVAQWINWSISTTRFDWHIRKPGTYAAPIAILDIASNGDVLMDFEMFEDLRNAEDPNSAIETKYGIGSDLPLIQWVHATDLNSQDVSFEKSQDLCEGIDLTLWNRITVVDCNSSGEYRDEAMIVLTLQNIKPWIDPNSGHFRRDWRLQPLPDHTVIQHHE